MDFLHKIKALEEAIAAEKGAFVLFAIVKREESPDRWDLLVSAPWFSENERETLDFFAQRMNKWFPAQEIVFFSRIILFPPTDPRVQEILRYVKQPVNHGNVELSSWTLSSMPVSHAHIITATIPDTASQSVQISFPQAPQDVGSTGTIVVQQ